MSINLFQTVLLSSVLIFFVANNVRCDESELFEELKGRESSLGEKISSVARTDWEHLMSSNLNGYYNSLVYKLYPDDFNKIPGFNTTKLTTAALVGHFFLILSGIYFLSLLPTGALNGLLPRMDFRNPFDRRRNRRRYHGRQEPYYNDYDYNEYDEYEYNFGRFGPPRDHHNRRLRHDPPVFNRRMVDAYDDKDVKMHRRNKFSSRNSKKEDVNNFSNNENEHSNRIVKRQATTETEAPWYEQIMNFVTGPFTRFQRSYAQVYDHYGDFWRFRLGADKPADKDSVIGKFKGILSKISTGVEKIAQAQRRSYSLRGRPQQQRHRNGHTRRRHHQNRPHHFQDESRNFKHNNEVVDYRPAPSAPVDEVVEALHEKK